MRLKTQDYPINFIYNSILKWVIFNPFWFSAFLIFGTCYKFITWYTITYPGEEWFVAALYSLLIVIVMIEVLGIGFNKLYPAVDRYVSEYQEQFHDEELEEKIEVRVNKIKKEAEDKCF